MRIKRNSLFCRSVLSLLVSLKEYQGCWRPVVQKLLELTDLKKKERTEVVCFYEKTVLHVFDSKIDFSCRGYSFIEKVFVILGLKKDRYDNKHPYEVSRKERPIIESVETN